MNRISVVIPLYNQQGSIGKTLSDLLLQSFDGFEIIVVDDASTDGSADSAEQTLLGARIRWNLLRLPANRGASEARNTGLDTATGEAVFFLDGDDRIAPETLACLWNSMKNTAAPVAFCGFRVCGESLEGGKNYAFPLSPASSSIPSRQLLREFLRGKRYLNASNVLYNRSFLQANSIRFPRGCRFAEDREFIAKALFNAETAAVVPDTHVSYIQHENQSTCRMARDPSKYAHEVGVYLRLRKYLEERQADAELLYLVDSLELSSAAIKMATSAARSGRIDLFWKTVRSSRLRELAGLGRGAWPVKPEVGFKAMLFCHAPGLLLRLYTRKAESVR
jgi:glycosyltransferase involved in cell wall biosynthesis